MTKPFKDTHATHEFIDLVRRLESQGYFSDDAIKHATTAAKNTDGSTLEKLFIRAEALDNEGELTTALEKRHAKLSFFINGWAGISLGIGFLSAMALLKSGWLNFFYLLLLLLGWHSISLILWLCLHKKKAPLSISGLLFDKFLSKDLKSPQGHLSTDPNNPLSTTQKPIKGLEDTATAVFLEGIKPTKTWRLSALMHKAWLCFLIGNIIALLLMFLARRYEFIWESTLLSQNHLANLVSIIGFLPARLGLGVPTHAELIMGSASPAKIAWLIIACVLFYGVLPRALAFFYCHYRSKKQPFNIDKNLYYYEKLARDFKERIVSADDFKPTTKTAIKTTLTEGKKIIASFEQPPKNPAWYVPIFGNDVLDIGVLDDKNDLIRLKTTLEQARLPVCLVVNSTLLPDRGVVRKFDIISRLAVFGFGVVFLEKDSTHSHYEAWQSLLMQHHIAEVDAG
ncbi:MAG: DUF2868 domain-containing protein [Moraxella sp.]|nr:DUF2868 domain-containing protein [Moraxella sp.]